MSRAHQSDRSEIKNILSRWYGSQFAIVLQSILIGFVTGFVVVGFRFALQWAGGLRSTVYEWLSSASPGVLFLWVLLVIGVGLFLGWMSYVKPMIKGSGIPQIKGALLRKLRLGWWPELPMKIIAGVLGLGFGMSLGREGPSVQVGAYVGRGFLGILKRPDIERKYLITSGAAAGLAAAFNAPLAGVLFALEELHRHFSPLLLACSMGASLAGDFVASRFFGLGPIFDFHTIEVLPLADMPWILILGALCALGGDLFKRALYAAQDLYVSLKIPEIVRPVLPMLLTIPLSFFLVDAVEGGHNVIEQLASASFGFWFLLLLFFVKIVFTAFCYGSGVAGGIFLPLLVAGALMGEAFGQILVGLGLSQSGTALNFVIIGMAAFFTGVVRAPVTGAVLILEMSGNFNHLLGLVSACMAAYVIGDLIHSKPVYDVLLQRLLVRNPSLYRNTPGRKVLLEIPVPVGSKLAGRLIKSVPWPDGTLVVGVLRGESDLVPNGNTELFLGDVVLVLTDESRASDARDKILVLGGDCGSA